MLSWHDMLGSRGDARSPAWPHDGGASSRWSLGAGQADRMAMPATRQLTRACSIRAMHESSDERASSDARPSGNARPWSRSEIDSLREGLRSRPRSPTSPPSARPARAPARSVSKAPPRVADGRVVSPTQERFAARRIGQQSILMACGPVCAGRSENLAVAHPRIRTAGSPPFVGTYERTIDGVSRNWQTPLAGFSNRFAQPGEGLVFVRLFRLPALRAKAFDQSTRGLR
jgi:hypothetical protein